MRLSLRGDAEREQDHLNFICMRVDLLLRAHRLRRDDIDSNAWRHGHYRSWRRVIL